MDIGCSQRKRPRRGLVQHEQDTAASDLEAIEKDPQGQIVYVDVGSTELHSILQARLNSIRPTASELQRLPLINQSRVLVEIEDAMGLNIFQMWIQNTLQLNSATGRALRVASSRLNAALRAAAFSCSFRLSLHASHSST